MRIAATGFVSSQSGSVASANAMLLRELVKHGITIDFFSKPSFVDPRECVSDLTTRDYLRLIDCTNKFGDGMRRRMAPNCRGLWGRLWGSFDAATYNKGLVRSMQQHATGDADLWLGDWARGRGSRPVVSFAQGPPGTDARSVLRHKGLITRLAGRSFASKLAFFARWRLTRGLPRFSFSQRIILGSEWSRLCLFDVYRIPLAISAAIPYPIDLNMFRPLGRDKQADGPLRLLWLGRFAPRKRLDLFLNGFAEAVRAGCDVTATVVGQSDFVPNYEQLVNEFPFPQRLRHLDRIQRTEVPRLMWDHDVICQPSEEENFGSSVAEGLACGMPAIVGATNGTADYLCPRSIILSDDDPSTLATAVWNLASAKRAGDLADTEPSRAVALQHFEPMSVYSRLIEVLSDVVDSRKSGSSARD